MVKITKRILCMFAGICIIIQSCLSFGYVIYEGHYDTTHILFLVCVIVTAIAALLLVVGAVLRNIILLWVWLAVILPTTIIVFIVHILIVHDEWEITSTLAIAADIIFTILNLCMIVIAGVNSLLYLRHLYRHKKG